ncbi:type III secretion system inner membrane ring lipoprotein SctJ [Dongshaea marina]|uniref:type III secretion system inner membrane ring lipoprotein SctJ n=1 Tax=Dongshaea marina TaxID=2047966 RepID=UPI001900F23A|nr:type III secretion inner membrane ring lipoprotein SctJ [Dongshaea marina]
MMFLTLRWGLLLVLLFLTGCKVNLYNNLPEQEANQMLALLMLNKIPAKKEVGKGGDVTLLVDKKQFINAVEILRQNGFPKRKRFDMKDIFPSGQLVTSPEQEKAKMNYLKEQQLEDMLSEMDGVIESSVSIAADKIDDTGRQKTPPSAAVLIKYSPEVNMSRYQDQIKGLIRDSIPGISYDKISILLMPATFRYSSNAVLPGVTKSDVTQRNQILFIAGIAGIISSLIGFMVLIFRRKAL